MKRAIIPILLLCSVVHATTYNIGPGETYETFTALVAAQTLAAGDIVDGGGNTFAETWTPDGSGAVGNVILLRNATVNAATLLYALNLSGKTYITCQNITAQNATSSGFRIGTGTFMTILDCVSTDCIMAVDESSGATDLVIDGLTVTGANPATGGAVNCDQTGVNVSLTDVTVTNAGTSRGVYTSAANNVTMTNVQVTGSTSTGIEIQNKTSGTIALTNIYTGVTSGGVAGGNGSVGLYLNNCDGCTVTASGIYAKNNGSDGVRFSGCNLLAGSTLADSECDDNTGTGKGLHVLNTANLAVSDTAANGNGGVNIYVDGAACSGVTFTNVTANDGAQDGFNAVNGVPDLACWYCVANGNGADDTDGTGDGFSWHDTCVANMFYCIAANNLNTGVAHVETSSGLIYGCTFANNGRADNTAAVRAGMYLTTTHASGFTVRNTISSGNYPCELWTEGSCDLNYNCWNPLDADQFWTTDGAAYKSWTIYHLTDANETNSFSADPLLTSAATNTVTLKQGSPCVNTGVNLGASYDDALSSASVWPSAVVTVLQGSYELWDIGAYAWATLPNENLGADSRYHRGGYRGLSNYRSRYRF